MSATLTDLRDAPAVARERETSVSGRRMRETIVRNVGLADSERNLVQAHANRRLEEILARI